LSVVNCSGKCQYEGRSDIETGRKQNRLGSNEFQIEGRKLTVDKAAAVRVSPRHVWRMLTAYRKEGASALAHGNRGRKPINTIEEGLRQQIVELAGDKYYGFNQQHFTEKLADKEGIKLSRSTVRRILLAQGYPQPSEKTGAQTPQPQENGIPRKVNCYKQTVVPMIGWKDADRNYV